MSEEDKIQKFFRTYFTENKVKEDVAEKIIKQAEQFEAKLKPKEFLGRFFDALKKSYDPKNPKSFINASKRFLFVISKLLGDGKKQKSTKYPEIISSQIVQYYLFFFEIIFKNHLHELTVDLKMCRMRWVKLITDAAFVKLREEILKKYKFNLDRGFSQENLQKIRKIHKKRGLNRQQSDFYLGIETNQAFKCESPKRKEKNYHQNSEYSSGDESEQQNGNGNKKMKMDYADSTSIYQPQGMYQGYEPQTGYNPIVPGGNDNHSYFGYSDPRFYRPQSGYPYNSPSMPTTYPGKEQFLDETPKTTAPNFQFPPPSHPQTLLYPYQNYPRPYQPPKTLSTYEFRQVNEPKRLDSSIKKVNKIREQLQKNLNKCRECGQMFQSGQNHDKHMTEHFFSSLQRVNETEVKGKIKKENKLKLMSIKAWQQSRQKSQQEKDEYHFEVLLSQIVVERSSNIVSPLCFFCNQPLQISFSTKYQDWVYSDAVKINADNQLGVIHFSCYECFKSDENSLDEQI